MPRGQRLLEVCVYMFIVSVRRPVGEEESWGGDGRRGPCPWVHTAGSAAIDAVCAQRCSRHMRSMRLCLLTSRDRD